MKMKVLALAVAAGFSGMAWSQSNVTISGKMAVSYHNYKLSDTAKPAATENRLDDAGSRFVLKGVEDLGGGLSAFFQIDNRISADTRPHLAYGNAQGLADGETFVGLASKDLGKISFGKMEMHYHETKGFSEKYRVENVQQVAGTGLFSKIDSTSIAGTSRLQNVIKYETPKFGGFTGKLAYSFNPAGNEGTLNFGNTGYATLNAAAVAADANYNKGYAWNAVARYNAGGVNAFFSYYKQLDEGQTRRGQKSYKVGADYLLPFGLQVGLNFDQSEIVGTTVAADNKRNAWLLPISYMTGAHGFYLTYAQADDRKVNGAKLANTGAKQWTLSYDYALSKRTFVGVSYVAVTNESAAIYSPHNAGRTTFGGSAVLVGGEDARQISFNMTHNF